MPIQSTKTKINSAISVKNLSVSLDGKSVLKDVSFTIKPGSIVAVIGPNGSGKTTLLRAILGIIPIDAGEISILDQPLHHVRQAIGYVPQRFSFDSTFPMTVNEYLRLAMHKEHPENTVEKALKYVGLKKSIGDQMLGSLSGGQLQRVLVAHATANKPRVLVLDEPYTGIDIAGEAAFYQIIQQLNKDYNTTVLLVSHDVSMVSKTVDQVICINHSLTCVGPPKKTLTKKTLENVFGTHTQLVSHGSKKKK